MGETVRSGEESIDESGNILHLLEPDLGHKATSLKLISTSSRKCGAGYTRRRKGGKEQGHG